MIVPGARFAVEIPAGWHAVWHDPRASETRLGRMFISGPERDFFMFITPCALARPWTIEWVTEDATWEDITRIMLSEQEARKPHRPCGDFRASEWRHAGRHGVMRGWFLNADQVLLRVDYTADLAVGTRDDAALRRMLDSMRLLPAPGAEPGGAAEGAGG